VAGQGSNMRDPEVDAIARELASDADLATVWEHHAPGLPSPRQVMTIEQATAHPEEDEPSDG